MSEVERSPQFELCWVSERHLRIREGRVPDDSTPAWIRQSADSLKSSGLAGRLRGVVSITPAYESILLEFDIHLLDNHTIEAVRQILAEDIDNPDEVATYPLIEIPVCYDVACALDIQDVARTHNIPTSEVARRHSQAEYSVRFIGFAPGFAYLDGLPSELVTPRLPTPRVRVPSGSVGIAGGQAGIYPFETAGGWRLIGRTPLTMFDPGRDRPALLEPGHRVRFVSITLEEFTSQRRGEDE